MKQFAIHAVCTEKSLWDILKLLESNRCTGIMARPLANGAAKPNGITRIDAALEIMRRNGKAMRALEVRDELQKAGFRGMQVGGMLHVLQERKLIRRSSPGRYVAVKKGAG
jgi:hypothetical protein